MGIVGGKGKNKLVKKKKGNRKTDSGGKVTFWSVLYVIPLFW